LERSVSQSFRLPHFLLCYLKPLTNMLKNTKSFSDNIFQRYAPSLGSDFLFYKDAEATLLFF
jgi:hypothetical protein